MKCVSGKRPYDSFELATEALIQHHIRNMYKPGEGPINVYLCDHCGSWHFTSKGVVHTLFEDPSVMDRIRLERRAFQWEQKLK